MQLVEIEFRGRRRAVFANPEEYPLARLDPVIVQADRGIDLGVVNLVGPEWEKYTNGAVANGREPAPVLRLATGEDRTRVKDNREFERGARVYFLEQVERLGLEMKLVEVECQLDRRKLTFYFTADGRVDFRELVKVLASRFRTRIDLRQIGARDESKRLGGIGICGRELCCATWVREFKPVTTSMMKDQHMILNPQKNTGPCGKLRCCLRFEVEQYRELDRQFPSVDTKVKGPRGQGVVTRFSYQWEHVGIAWEDGTKYSYGREHLDECSDWDPEGGNNADLVVFHEDPSLEQQRKEEQEGELVARGVPRDNDDPRVSVRSVPKSGTAAAGEHGRACGKKDEGGGGGRSRGGKPGRKKGKPGGGEKPRGSGKSGKSNRRRRGGRSRNRGRGGGKNKGGGGNPGAETGKTGSAGAGGKKSRSSHPIRPERKRRRGSR